MRLGAGATSPTWISHQAQGVAVTRASLLRDASVTARRDSRHKVRKHTRIGIGNAGDHRAADDAGSDRRTRCRLAVDARASRQDVGAFRRHGARQAHQLDRLLAGRSVRAARTGGPDLDPARVR